MFHHFVLIVALSATETHGVASPSLWLPANEGWAGFVKPFWFGANANGPSSDSTLELMSRHPVAGYGWQQGGPPAVGEGEVRLSDAMARARSYMNSVNNDKTMLFVYRQVQVSLRLFEIEAKLDDNPSFRDFWLHDPTYWDPSLAGTCTAPQPWGTADPYWNFTNQDGVAHWLDEVIGYLTSDPPMQGGRAAVFFDEVDQGTCGYRGGNCDFGRFDSEKLQLDSNKMLGKMVKLLNDAGIVPILSLDNRLEASQAMLPGLQMPCALPEDRLLEELAGLTWVRFYENFPQSFWVPGGADLAAAMVENAILEARHGVPVAFRVGGGGCPAPSRSIERPGRLGGDIEFAVALYLIVQDPSLGFILSVSNDWFDRNQCWRPEWDVDFGTPLAEATRTSPHSWTRKYTMATVFLDVSSNSGEVQLMCDPMPCPPPKPGWSEPSYCTSCQSSPVLKDLGTGLASVETCKSACEANPSCTYINFAEGNHACELYAKCDDPITYTEAQCGGPHSWWTTWGYTPASVVV